MICVWANNTNERSIYDIIIGNTIEESRLEIWEIYT